MVPPDGGGLKYSNSALFSAAFAMIYRILDFNFLGTPDDGFWKNDNLNHMQVGSDCTIV